MRSGFSSLSNIASAILHAISSMSPPVDSDDVKAQRIQDMMLRHATIWERDREREKLALFARSYGLSGGKLSEFIREATEGKGTYHLVTDGEVSVQIPWKVGMYTFRSSGIQDPSPIKCRLPHHIEMYLESVQQANCFKKQG